MADNETSSDESTKKSDPPPSEEPKVAESEEKAEEKAETKASVPPKAEENDGISTKGTPLGKAGKKKKKKSGEPAIRIKKVTKRFGAKIAVDDLSLTIDSGTVFGLIGPNGAGKTTTFSMMSGFLRPTSGTVEVLGFYPHQTDMLRSRVGILPQDAILPPIEQVGEFLTTLARLQMVSASEAEGLAMAVLEEVEGKDWWKVKCGALSHGMAKRVQLAQALLGNPDVVLLDEPTAGLDPRSAYEVRQLIKRRKGRCTMIVSSHNLQELEEVCDAAAILDRGRLVTSGSIADLTASTQEVHVKIAPPAGDSGYRSAEQSVPMAKVRQLPGVSTAEWDDDRQELVVHFDRKTADAEAVIAHTLWLLLNEKVRISGVTKGKSLEARVMDLTDEDRDEDDDD
ncbi:MAG TPA: ABC transporter ATP-binding protein [Polyangiaceae bacterium]